MSACCWAGTVELIDRFLADNRFSLLTRTCKSVAVAGCKNKRVCWKMLDCRVRWYISLGWSKSNPDSGFYVYSSSPLPSFLHQLNLSYFVARCTTELYRGTPVILESRPFVYVFFFLKYVYDSYWLTQLEMFLWTEKVVSCCRTTMVESWVRIGEFTERNCRQWFMYSVLAE